MTASYYPDAKWLGDGVPGGHYVADAPWRLGLHTTETKTLPDYNNGLSAPHLTYHPLLDKFYQHTDLRLPCRALRHDPANNPGSTETNALHTLQMEIVCYSDQTQAVKVGGIWVGDLTAYHLSRIRQVIVFTHEEFGVQYVWPGRQAYSYAEARAAGFRFTAAEWLAYGGVFPHQIVPFQAPTWHWDTGALDWPALMGPLMEDDMPDPRISDDDATFLTNFAANVRSTGSDSSYPRYLIPWYRKWKGLDPEDVDENAEVDALENTIIQLVVRIEALEDTPAAGDAIQSGDTIRVERVE